MKNTIIKLLEDNKCENIQSFKCDGYISENIIIATVFNGIHSVAVSEKIISLAKESGEVVLADGNAQDGWIAVEVANVIIHLMTQQKREYFNIEDFLKTLKKKPKS
ncbi:MAG: ribosome silencing factor [Proteobacteria bacterium]|jgi:ribosome silencing factor RsfS/YbeB/iojap|nr:ribosome silencing factor [Pseudomonadota bacterium]